MDSTDITLATVCDYGARVRGKGFRDSQADKAIKAGVGLAYSNLMITCFGEIVDTPWGASGDLLMMPIPDTEVIIPAEDGFAAEKFMLSDLANLDGSPWACCPRSWLKRGLAALENEFGLKLNSAFEHEFHYSGIKTGHGSAYGLDAWRFQNGFGQRLVSVLDQNGVEPEMVMPEYAPQQMEITNAPAIGVEAADRAVKLREITRSVAYRAGQKATFSPLMPGGSVGNGVHIHFSLCDLNNVSQSYDPSNRYNLSEVYGRFIAGVLAHMNEFVALTAASSISYERLQPNRWSASHNNLGNQDREAGVRICPLSGGSPEKSFNVEYRAADATANPYLALGAIVWAGLEGLRKAYAIPEATEGDLSPSVVERLDLQRLPSSLDEALNAFEASSLMKEAMGAEFLAAYATNKRGELKLVAPLDYDAQVARYAQCF